MLWAHPSDALCKYESKGTLRTFPGFYKYFFEMTYIQSIPIDSHIEVHHLTLRLNTLFLDVSRFYLRPAGHRTVRVVVVVVVVVVVGGGLL